jgi:hypothetical protein
MKQKPTGLDWAAIKAPEPEDPKPKLRGRVAINLTEKEIAEAVADYGRGARASDVAFTYGVSFQTVLAWVRAAGQPVRPKGSRIQPDDDDWEIS